MERDKLIQKYLHSELSKAEHEVFLDLHKTDPDFAEEVKIQSVFYAARSKDLKHTLRKDLENAPIHHINEKKQSKQLYLILRNVAAILILGLTSFYFFNSLSSTKSTNNFQELVESHIQNRHDPPFTTMNADDKLEEPWKVAYRTQNYSVTIDQLSKINNPSNEQTLYLALSHMYADIPNIEKTIFELKGLLANNNNVINDEAQWFLSLAYLQSGDINNGNTLLKKIVSEESWNHKKASKLLQEFQQENQ